MQNVYVVMGQTGEYSDRREWPVAAFHDEPSAKALVVQATRRANEIETQANALPWKEQDALYKTNEVDPDFESDYTGTSYFYYTVPLR